MRAYIYDITIVDSVMDMIHGGSYSIKELYIPALHIIANMGGNSSQIQVFSDYGSRKKDGKNIKAIDIDKNFGYRLQEILQNRDLKTELQRLLK